MFQRLFGETESEQLAYLKKKIIITVVFLVIDIVLMLVKGEAGVSVILVYIWGWGAMKALFGITAVGSIFSGNPVMAAVFIVAYALIGAIFGFFCMLLGIGRFIYLMVKARQYKG